LISRVGVKPFAVLGSVVTAIGFILQSFVPSYNMVLALEFVTGAGLSMINASVINFLILTVDPRDMGLATGMNGTFRSVGSAIGAPIAGSLLSTYTASYTIAYVGGHPITKVLPSHLAFYYAFVIAAATFVAGIVTIVFGREVLGKRSLKETERRNSRLNSRRSDLSFFFIPPFFIDEDESANFTTRMSLFARLRNVNS